MTGEQRKNKESDLVPPVPFLKGLTKPLIKKFGDCTLIFGGTPKNGVFLGYFPEQDRYPDQIRDFHVPI
jgi:hypothetical protein